MKKFEMNMAQAVEAMSGQAVNANDLACFSRVSIDNRQVRPGDLFVAIRGDRFDGHAFMNTAREAGADKFVVDEAKDGFSNQCVVEDTRAALGALAAAWRTQSEADIVAVTGSNGKTTVKEMLGSILSISARTLVTAGNFNNEIGVPLMLLKLMPAHRFAVLELGANHYGEIANMIQWVRPRVALLNNAMGAHLEGFGSLEDVAKAKSEIFDTLGPDQTAIFNADSEFEPLWRAKTQGVNLLTFGQSDRADVGVSVAKNVVEITLPNGVVSCTLRVPGFHNAMNAAAAATAAHALGIGNTQIMHGLEDFSGVPGRLRMINVSERLTVIDDTYNANPSSVKAAIDVLHQRQGQRILVLGEMGELGENAADSHEECGKYAKQLGIEHVVATGQYADKVAAGFGAGSFICVDTDEAVRRVVELLRDKVTVLVKGSRFAKMERVIDQLVNIHEEMVPGRVEKE